MRSATLILAASLLSAGFLPATAQDRTVSLPDHAQTLTAPSPNKAWTLIGDAPSSKLSIEDNATHARRPIFGVTVQTMSVLWSPDSASFIANDREASNVEDSYLYDAATLKRRLDLRDLILAADPQAKRVVTCKTCDHSYVRAYRWLDPTHLAVQLSGHYGGWMSSRDVVVSARCFQYRYSVSTTGMIARLDHHNLDASDPRCQTFESAD